MKLWFSPVFASISSVFAIAAWQDQLDWGLRIAASLIAIGSGVAAFLHTYKNK